MKVVDFMISKIYLDTLNKMFYLNFFFLVCQTEYSCIKHVIKRTSLCEQSATRGETC